MVDTDRLLGTFAGQLARVRAERGAYSAMLLDERLRALADAGAGAGTIVEFGRVFDRFPPPAADRNAGRLLLLMVTLAKGPASAQLDRVAAALAGLPPKWLDADAFDLVCDTIEEVAAAVPDATGELAAALPALTATMTTAAWSRWTRWGVQQQHDDLASTIHWLRRDSVESRTAMKSAGLEKVFEDLRRALALAVRALWRAPWELRTLETRNAAQRDKAPRVRFESGAILVPPTLEPVPGIATNRLYLAAVMHAAAHLEFSSQRFPVRTLKPAQVALVSLIEDARVEALAMRRFPGLARLWRACHVARPSPLLAAPLLFQRLSRALADPAYEDDGEWIRKGRTMFDAAVSRWDDPAIAREIGGLLGNDLGQMRVRFDFRAYQVEPPYRDDHLGLWDLGDPPGPPPEDADVLWQAAQPQPADADPPDDRLEDEADESERGKPDAVSPMPLAPGTDLAPPAQNRHEYPEWDYLIDAERPAWATVFERPIVIGPDDPGLLPAPGEARLVKRLVGMAMSMNDERPVRMMRQLEGDRLDLEAAIRAAIDLRTGVVPSARLYETRARAQRDTAVLLLLDSSRSTGKTTASDGRTVIELTRQAALLFGEALSRLGDRFAIDAFRSAGRQDVEYLVIKDFDQRFDEDTRRRLGRLDADRSTRMGAALRHAGTRFATIRARRRLLIMVTDGAPYDIDIFDSRYLVQDARVAAHALRRQGIATLCLSLDRASTEATARVFGERNHQTLDHLHKLPERLSGLYLRVMR